MFIPRGVLGGEGKPGANAKIRVGAIGVGHRATMLLDQLPEDAQLVALCDCNLPRAEEFKRKRKGAWPVLQDHRQLLDRHDIDAVVVGTGEFQRVLPCIHACQAGKDVYAEKPLTLYIQEGRALVEAVRRHGRILQVGSQQRSMAMNRIACELVRRGGLGKLLEVRAVNYPGSSDSPAQPFPEQPVPKGLDWDRWLNQAAQRPFNSRWMGWMGWRDFAGGEISNWGAHGVDQIQWALGADESGPVELWPLPPDAAMPLPDAGSQKSGDAKPKSPPPVPVAARYANGVEVHFVLAKAPMGGAIFIGEKGKLEVNRNKFASNPPEIAEELRKTVDVTDEERKWSDKAAMWQARWHIQNWLDCIRTRQKPVADVEIGHRSISFCHLVAITRRVGRRLKWDPAREQFESDDAANALVTRPRRKGYELPAQG